MLSPRLLSVARIMALEKVSKKVFDSILSAHPEWDGIDDCTRYSAIMNYYDPDNRHVAQAACSTLSGTVYGYYVEAAILQEKSNGAE